LFAGNRLGKETLNAMLDAEADQLCGVKKYERSDKRTNGRENVLV
jgi:transposase-like protein